MHSGTCKAFAGKEGGGELGLRAGGPAPPVAPLSMLTLSLVAAHTLSLTHTHSPGPMSADAQFVQAWLLLDGGQSKPGVTISRPLGSFLSFSPHTPFNHSHNFTSTSPFPTTASCQSMW